MLLCGLTAQCTPAPRPPLRCASGSRWCLPGSGARPRPGSRSVVSGIALPPDDRRRYLQSTAPLPLPPDNLLVHLELGSLPQDGLARRVIAGVWSGLRADSMAAGQLLPYLKGCGIHPLKGPRAITLIQPLDVRPDVDRVVIFWGLLTAQRTVICLKDAMEAHGAKVSLLLAGGEPAFSADRPVSDLHLDAMALDSETLLVAAGPVYRRAVRQLMQGKGRSLAAQPLYRRAVRAAPPETLLLAVAPRLPRRLPHLKLPSSVRQSVQGSAWILTRGRRRDPAGGQPALRLASMLDVAGKGRARRWAAKLPSQIGRVTWLLPPRQKSLLRRTRATARGGRLLLRLDLKTADMVPFGKFVSRWLPW